MSKSNKELAVEVAIALIQANPRVVYKSDNVIQPSLTLESVTNIIRAVDQVLCEVDKKSGK